MFITDVDVFENWIGCGVAFGFDLIGREFFSVQLFVSTYTTCTVLGYSLCRHHCSSTRRRLLRIQKS